MSSESFRKISEICELKPQKKESKERLRLNEEVSFLPMRDLGVADKCISSKLKKPLAKVYSGYTYFSDGDVLLAKITPCFENGKLGIAKNLVNGIGFGSSEYHVLRPSSEILAEYLFYFLMRQEFRNEGKKVMTGSVGHKRVPPEFIENQEIYLPSLQEQKRIVEILDEAFAAIDKAIENTEKNIKNAKELFESYLNQVFSEKGEGWEEKTLAEVSLDFGRGKSKHRPRNAPHLYGGPYPFIQTGEIRKSIHLIKNYTKTYSEEGLAQSKLWPKGTICITIAANIAETGILGFNGCFPDSVIGIVVDPNKTSKNYVEYLLQSMSALLKSKGKGSAQDNINLGTFENQKFNFPSIIIQKNIVGNLNHLSNYSQNIAKIHKQKLTTLKQLKQSLLQKAFTGELTKDFQSNPSNKPKQQEQRVSA